MKRVLLVDDSPTVVGAAYDELDEAGYIVDVAYNGLEAIQRIDDNMPDIIIMDIEMPKMRGDVAVQRIKANPAWRHIPVIALTGQSEDTIGETIKLFDAYLIKPFGFEQMLELVRLKLEPTDYEEIKG